VQVDGLVFGAFFMGYFCTQILGGWSAAHFGGKRTLGVAVTMWSLWTLLTPAAAMHSVTALLLCRIALGTGTQPTPCA
jgi:ACS family sodium-dependent inorganic phosphate cotransporter